MLIRLLLLCIVSLTACAPNLSVTSVTTPTAETSTDFVDDNHIATLVEGDSQLLIRQDEHKTQVARHLPQSTATKFAIYRLNGFTIPEKPTWWEGEFAGCCRIKEPIENWNYLIFSEDKFQQEAGLYLIQTQGRIQGWDEEDGTSDDLRLGFYIETFGNGHWRFRWDLTQSDHAVNLNPVPGKWLTVPLVREGNLLIAQGVDLSRPLTWNMVHTYYQCGERVVVEWSGYQDRKSLMIIPRAVKTEQPDWPLNQSWTADFWHPLHEGPVPPTAKEGTSSTCPK